MMSNSILANQQVFSGRGTNPPFFKEKPRGVEGSVFP
jgi:hypothetical protein